MYVKISVIEYHIGYPHIDLLVWIPQFHVVSADLTSIMSEYNWKIL